MGYFDRNVIKALVQQGRLSAFQRDTVIKVEGKAWLDAIEREVGHKSQRPTVTLADLQRKAKALSSAIKSTAQATKDVQDAVEAESVRELLDLAYQLDLNENAVLELVKQYSLIEVTTILRTLSTVKSTGKGFKSVFFGVTTDSPDISDVQMMLKQTSGFDPFFT